MKTAFFSSKPYDRHCFEEANRAFGHQLAFLEPRLDRLTAPLAAGFDSVCCFVNDSLDADTIGQLSALGVRAIALRCAGFNNVDLEAAARSGVFVARVPAYSPHAVAEHTLALILALNRKIHRAYNRVRESNFALEGLLGFDLHGRVAGVVGTGKIGANVVRILAGFGCRVLARDPYPDPECERLGARYVEMDELLRSSDIVTLHCPLAPESHHLIDASAIAKMKDGAMLINTSRGALVDTRAAIAGLKSGKLGYLGLDVYEEESELFFEDLSSRALQDDVFARLTTFPNAIVTGHQAFFTEDALRNIAQTTLGNLRDFEATGDSPNRVLPPKPAP